MVCVRNKGIKEFTRFIQEKRLYLFGAGMAAEQYIDTHCNEKKIEAIIDNNKELWGKKKKIKDQEIEIISIYTFAERIGEERLEDIILLIMPLVYTTDIISQLDDFPQLNELNCYVYSLIRDTKETAPKYEFTKGEQKIPKIIHYFWLGGNPIPQFMQKCIDSWQVHNPEFKIMRWDESNYDISKNSYMKEAYEDKAWGFVSDYARLDVIYQYGGIYLDTDIEVLGNLDVLLNDDAFFNMEDAETINTGAGFGAAKGNEFIKEQRDYYDDKHYSLPNGKRNKNPNIYYQHPVFKKYGFQIKNEYQKINNIVIYPSEVMSPRGRSGLGNFFSDKTLAIHYGTRTWQNERERKGRQKIYNLFLERVDDLKGRQPSKGRLDWNDISLY